MKRKRFIRLVMSYYVQRNGAERMTADVKQAGSYAALFEAIEPGLSACRLVAKVKIAMRNVGSAFESAAQAITNLWEAMPDEVKAIANTSPTPPDAENETQGETE